MNTNVIIGILAVLVLAGAAFWYLAPNETSAPATVPSAEESVIPEESPQAQPRDAGDDRGVDTEVSPVEPTPETGTADDAPAASAPRSDTGTTTESPEPTATDATDMAGSATATDATTTMGAPSESGVNAETDAVTITLDSFNYGYSQEEIRVTEGDTVTVNLTNSEGFHDWVVDEFDAATERISAGETTSVTFVADAAGEYEYYCSVGNHRAQGMVGTLVVEPAE